MALVHTTFRSKRRLGRLSLLQYLLSANSVRYFCMLPHGVINDDDDDDDDDDDIEPAT